MIVLVVIFAYGIAIQVLLQPNQQPSMRLFGRIWARGFYTIQRNFFYRDDVFSASKSKIKLIPDNKQK